MGFWSPQDWNFRKIGHFRNFEKQPIQSNFFDLFGHFMYKYAFLCNKIFNFDKNGRIFAKSSNFQKISAPAAPKIGHFSPFFQFFGAEKLVTLGQNWPPFCPLAPPNSSPDLKSTTLICNFIKTRTKMLKRNRTASHTIPDSIQGYGSWKEVNVVIESSLDPEAQH